VKVLTELRHIINKTQKFMGRKITYLGILEDGKVEILTRFTKREV